MDLKNLKEFRERLGVIDPEKVSNLLMAVIEITIRTEATLDTILKNQIEIMAVIHSQDPSDVNKEFNEDISKTYNILMRDVADFILPT